MRRALSVAGWLVWVVVSGSAAVGGTVTDQAANRTSGVFITPDMLSNRQVFDLVGPR
jgi:hypothetical protein